jgi:hypothetical protein
MSKDIFENLVTEITEQVLRQVQQQVDTVVADSVTSRLDALINTERVNATIEERINRAVVQYQPDLSVVEKNIQTLTTNWSNQVSTDINKKVEQVVTEKINSVDLAGLIIGQINAVLDPERKAYPFPENSIEGSAINVNTLKISGDNILGGVVKNFGSTGIDDQATECKVTILDQGTVFENTLYAPRVEVKGGALIDGDLEIRGRIVDSPAYQQLVSDVVTRTQTVITDELLQQHQNVVFERIVNEGIDLNKVTFNGRLLVEGDRLVGVVNSQLRTVGTLQDLQTQGETMLSDTLYTANKRTGINTMDPKTALSIWDEEVELGIGKYQKNVAKLATERETSLILGSNGKNNITLRPDGSVEIEYLRINNMAFTSASAPPSYDAVKGTVVFNENPSLGGPLGWVSLGDARWANFGIID